jgi:hypothetical protein
MLNSSTGNSGNTQTRIKDKHYNIVKRIKLKRQSKLVCTLDEKWNNYDNISK